MQQFQEYNELPNIEIFANRQRDIFEDYILPPFFVSNPLVRGVELCEHIFLISQKFTATALKIVDQMTQIKFFEFSNEQNAFEPIIVHLFERHYCLFQKWVRKLMDQQNKNKESQEQEKEDQFVFRNKSRLIEMIIMGMALVVIEHYTLKNDFSKTSSTTSNESVAQTLPEQNETTKDTFEINVNAFIVFDWSILPDENEKATIPTLNLMSAHKSRIIEFLTVKSIHFFKNTTRVFSQPRMDFIIDYGDGKEYLNKARYIIDKKFSHSGWPVYYGSVNLNHWKNRQIYLEERRRFDDPHDFMGSAISKIFSETIESMNRLAFLSKVLFDRIKISRVYQFLYWALLEINYNIKNSKYGPTCLILDNRKYQKYRDTQDWYALFFNEKIENLTSSLETFIKEREIHSPALKSSITNETNIIVSKSMKITNVKKPDESIIFEKQVKDPFIEISLLNTFSKNLFPNDDISSLERHLQQKSLPKTTAESSSTQNDSHNIKDQSITTKKRKRLLDLDDQKLYFQNHGNSQK